MLFVIVVVYLIFINDFYLIFVDFNFLILYILSFYFEISNLIYKYMYFVRLCRENKGYVDKFIKCKVK